MPDSIQSQKYSRDGGIDDASHITDSNGNPNVFYIKRNDDGKPWFNTNWINPDNEWNLDNEIVFRLCNSLYFSLVRSTASGETTPMPSPG